MKKTGKKLYLILFVIFIISLLFFSYFKHNKIAFDDNDSKKSTPYTLIVKYLLVDEKNTPESLTIDDANYKYNESILYSTISYVGLYKNGENYIAKLNNVNSLIKDTTDYLIAYNNSNGQLIEDANYNIKNKTFTIPKKYIESDKKNKSPVQIQLLKRIDFDSVKKTKIELNYLNKKKMVELDGYEVSTEFSIFKYDKGRNIEKKDIRVKINDLFEVSNDSITWDSKAGNISIPMSPLLIDKIEINISKKAQIKNKASNILYLNKADAVSFDKMKSVGTLASAPENISVGDSFTGQKWVNYVSSDSNYNALSPEKKAAYNNAYKYLYGINSCNWNSSICTWNGKYERGSEASTSPFILTVNVLESGNGSAKKKIDFPNPTYIVLFCDHVGSPAVPSGDTYINVNVKVLAYNPTKKYIVIGFSTSESIGTQNGYGVYKFKWDSPDNGQISVSKKFKNGTPSSKAGYTFQLYDDKSCSSRISSEKTNSSGIAVFDDLEFDTYYLKEKVNSSGIPQAMADSGDDIDQSFVPVKNCIPVTVDNDASKKSGNTYITSVSFDNRKRKYCVKVKKVDAETNTPLAGITFNLNGQGLNLNETTTGSDGIATFKELTSSGAYTLTEVSADGTLGYWNDSTTTSNSTSVNAVEMSYKDSDNTYSCDTNTIKWTKSDHKQYYCLKVKKTDKFSGQPLQGAEFTATYGSYSTTATSDENGIATFFMDTNSGTGWTVTETKAPEGSALSSPNTISGTTIGVSTTAMTREITQNDAIKNLKTVGYCNAPVTDALTYKNPVLVMNWYKVDENGKAVTTTETDKTAKFKVSNPNGYLKFKPVKVSTTDTKAIPETKDCYQYDPNNNLDSIDTLESDANGEVCVRGVPQGTYTVEEVQPAQYHTFGNSNEITLSTSTIFSPKTSSNVFINLPTTFKFKKYVAKVDGGDGDEKIVVNGVEKTLTELTTEELKKIDFQIFNSAGQVMDFYYDEATGKYNFGGNVIDPKVSQTGTNILHLNNDREIVVDHLPWGETFTIKEVQSKVCDPNASEEDCIGYYYPNYNEQGSTFTVTTCSNDGSGIDKCPSTNKVVILGLTNTPTEINFTKRDFYGYNDQADIEDKDRDKDKVDSSVEFENAKERSDFDRITFKLKNKLSGKYLTLKFVKNHGNCKTDDSYAEYRYVLGDQSDPNGTELHTCGGHIKITNLCRGNEYIVEEISVPEDSVYVKEKDENGNNPSVDYKVACTDGSFTPESTTHIINDKPTRVRFEKRDSKYNYLIPDETTTFKLYRCKKGEECHPGDYSTDKEREAAGMELVKFYDRGVITNDEEDPSDAEGLAGVEVYRRMSDSDAEAGAKVITDLHPYKGILVMRYLQANYNYVLLETVAPKNYQLPLGRNAETPFKPVNDTVDVDPVDVPNKPTSLLIKKYDSKGNLLPGAEFKIYEGTSCDKNLSAMNQPKKELKLKTIRDGIYENRETKDTDIVKTCKDREDEKCSDINPNGPVTNLTYSETVRNQALNNSYLGSFADFADDSTATKDGKKIEINEGTALIQYLEYGHCYIIEETKAPEGHSLPKKAEDRFTMVTIDENDAYAHSTYYKFINKPTPFQFYKYDEFNQLLDGAEFKLQKLDDNKKYQDVTVSLDEDLKKLEEINDDNSDALNNQINNLRTQAEEGVPFYRVDSETDNKTITTKNGTAVVYYLSQGQYRIIETKPAPGKELTKNPNIATFFVDDSGNVYGNSIIVNKAKTERIEVKNSASAELIVNIQTGQTVIRYGLIIAIIAALITGLMILKNKMK